MLFDQETFVNEPEFYEEFTLASAQNFICREMSEQNVTKVELAKRLGKSKGAITRLLSDGRNLTMRSFGRILHALGVEAKFTAKSIEGARYSKPRTTMPIKLPVEFIMVEEHGQQYAEPQHLDETLAA